MIALKEHFDKLRGWRKGLSLKVHRIYSSGQLLFEVLGVAGYAGYFAAMHTLMRLCSAVLLGGTWYAIYRAKAATRQLDRSARFPQAPTVRRVCPRFRGGDRVFSVGKFALGGPKSNNSTRITLFFVDAYHER